MVAYSLHVSKARLDQADMFTPDAAFSVRRINAMQDVMSQLGCVTRAFDAAKLADHAAPHVDLASLSGGAPLLPTLNGCAGSSYL